jgi:hypothetical protein
MPGAPPTPLSPAGSETSRSTFSSPGSVCNKSKSRADEIAFLEHGLMEAHRTTHAVFMENEELRARMQLITILTQKLAATSGLPQEVLRDLQQVMDCAVPPRGLLESTVPMSDCKDKNSKLEDCSDNQQQTLDFACSVQNLCKSMDRYDPATQRGKKKHFDSSEGPECEPPTDAELFALEDVGLWNRTKNVCMELFDGW